MAFLTSSRRHVPDLTASSDAVTKLGKKPIGSSWVISKIFTWAAPDIVTLKAVTPSHSVHLSDFPHFWDFVVFRTFSLQKRPKMLLLWFSPQKYLKWEKKQLWVKSDQIIYELELKRLPKIVTFFASSNTLILEICLSSRKCAFILIKIQVMGHSMQT